MRTSWLLIAVMTTALCGDARAQSLADVANAEASRRAAVKTPGKRYTNDDLTAAPAAQPIDAAPPPLLQSASKPEAAPGKQGGEGPAEEKKTEKYWKDRARAIRQSLARNTMMLDAFQTQINGLNAEFLRADDPGHRAVLETRILNVLTERQRVQQDIDNQKQAAVDLEEEARKGGIPSGWLR